MKQLNKQMTLGILAQAIDIANQTIWANVQAKKLDKKKAEHMLVNFESAMKYCQVMLHDVLTGKTAEYIERIEAPSGSVLMGHQAQAMYLRLSFEDIWDLSVRCWEAEEDWLRFQEAIEEAEKQRDIDEGIIRVDIDPKTGQMKYRMEEVHPA